MTRDVVGVLAAVADHRATLTAGWLTPPVIVLTAPEQLITPLLLALMGVVIVFHQAQLARLPPLGDSKGSCS